MVNKKNPDRSTMFENESGLMGAICQLTCPKHLFVSPNMFPVTQTQPK